MKRGLKLNQTLPQKALEFINTGISCNCLVLLKELKLLDFLLAGNSIDQSVLEDRELCINPTAVYSALVTLEKAGIVERIANQFSLTDLGRALADYIGLITMLFDGYGSLMVQQRKIARNQIRGPSKFLRVDSIAEASIHFGKDTVDPIIEKIFKRFKIKGTICDLGCGLGTRLAWLCKETDNPGLGLENDIKTVNLARKKYKKNSTILFEKGNITKLNGIWEDVTIIMQYFVFHDFVNSKKCTSILNSYLKHFPNLKCFIYVDVVSPSSIQNEIMPGYDYVHGLLGITTPTYEETIELFEKSNFRIMEEFEVPGLPNTFIWMLCPKKLPSTNRLD